MPESQRAVFELKLADADSESLGTLPNRIEVGDSSISIFPKGHGDYGSADGHGCPLFIEFYRGCLRVIVFPDINVEVPQIIDLSGAREHRRFPEDTLYQSPTPFVIGDNAIAFQ